MRTYNRSVNAPTDGRSDWKRRTKSAGGDMSHAVQPTAVAGAEIAPGSLSIGGKDTKVTNCPAR